MESKVDKAVEEFRKGFNCAQSVLISHAEEFGLDETLAKKITGPFGGGIAYNGEVCGAVTGALILIGLKYGRYREDDTTSKETTNRITNEFLAKFRKEFGHIKCNDLLGFNLGNEEELKQAREAGLFRTHCKEFVRRATELVEEVLN